MKTFLALGQSTCYGMDLSPGPYSEISRKKYREDNCFLGLVASRINYKLVNLSRPKASLKMLCRQLEEYDGEKPDLIFLGVPSAVAREIFDPTINEYVQVTTKNYFFPKWPVDENGIPKAHTTDFQKKCYENLVKYATQEELLRMFEIEILHFFKLVDKLNAKCCIMQMAPLIPNIINETGFTDIENPEKRISKYVNDPEILCPHFWVDFDRFNAVDSTKSFPKGKTGHVLEDGHLFLANKLYDHIINTQLL